LSIQFWKARGKLKKKDLLRPASLFKLVLELWAAITLEGLDRKGKFLAQIWRNLAPALLVWLL